MPAGDVAVVVGTGGERSSKLPEADFHSEEVSEMSLLLMLSMSPSSASKKAITSSICCSQVTCSCGAAAGMPSMCWAVGAGHRLARAAATVAESHGCCCTMVGRALLMLVLSAGVLCVVVCTMGSCSRWWYSLAITSRR